MYGQARRSGWTIEIQNPEWEELGEDGDALGANRIVPVYPLTEGVRQIRLRKMMWEALQTHLPLVEEVLPPDILLRHQLISAESATRNIHFPDSEPDRIAARRRLIFEEFFALQTLLALRRRAQSHDARGIVFAIDPDRLASDLAQIVPFTLTKAQSRAIREIGRGFDERGGR